VDLLFFLISELFTELAPLDAIHWARQLSADYKLLMQTIMEQVASASAPPSGDISVTIGDSDTYSSMGQVEDSHPSFIDDEDLVCLYLHLF